MNREDLRANVLPFVVGFCIAILSWRPLPELDFGWHLSTGLWIVDNGHVPLLDPFGAQGSEWIAYSWLFELLLAVVYRSLGFLGLQCLQSVSILFLFAQVFCFYRSRAKPGNYSELVAFLGVLLLWSPFLYLRPHLFSLVFLVPFIGLLDSRVKLNFGALIFVALWANIHLYWVLVPILLLLRATLYRSSRDVAIAIVATVVGFLTPYGLHLYKVYLGYSLFHQEATGMISEFSALSLEHGIYFWLYLLSGALISGLQIKFWKTSSGLSKLFSIFSLFAAFYQIKYFIFLGVSLLWTLRGVSEQKVEYEGCSNVANLVGLCIGYFVSTLVLFSMGFLPSPLSSRVKNLSVIASSLPQNSSGVILNHFNDGGAIALEIYLRKLSFRTSIDGRTLVMGPKRLQDWNSIANGAAESCQLVESWNPRFAIVEKESELGSLIFDGPCAQPWKVIQQCGSWVLLANTELVTNMNIKPIDCSAR